MERKNKKELQSWSPESIKRVIFKSIARRGRQESPLKVSNMVNSKSDKMLGWGEPNKNHPFKKRKLSWSFWLLISLTSSSTFQHLVTFSLSFGLPLVKREQRPLLQGEMVNKASWSKAQHKLITLRVRNGIVYTNTCPMYLNSESWTWNYGDLVKAFILIFIYVIEFHTYSVCEHIKASTQIMNH